MYEVRAAVGQRAPNGEDIRRKGATLVGSCAIDTTNRLGSERRTQQIEKRNVILRAGRNIFLRYVSSFVRSVTEEPLPAIT